VLLLPIKVLLRVLSVEVLFRRVFLGVDEAVEVVLEAVLRVTLGVLGVLRTLPDLEPRKCAEEVRCGAAWGPAPLPLLLMNRLYTAESNCSISWYS